MKTLSTVSRFFSSSVYVVVVAVVGVVSEWNTAVTIIWPLKNINEHILRWWYKDTMQLLLSVSDWGVLFYPPLFLFSPHIPYTYRGFCYLLQFSLSLTLPLSPFPFPPSPSLAYPLLSTFKIGEQNCAWTNKTMPNAVIRDTRKFQTETGNSISLSPRRTKEWKRQLFGQLLVAVVVVVVVNLSQDTYTPQTKHHIGSIGFVRTT